MRKISIPEVRTSVNETNLYISKRDLLILAYLRYGMRKCQKVTSNTAKEPV